MLASSGLILVLGLCSAASAILSPAPNVLPEGSKCYSNGATAVSCEGDLVCELTQLPDESNSFSEEGVCRPHPVQPPACTIAHCSKYGATAACTLDSHVATCAAWADSLAFPGCYKCPSAENWNCAKKTFLSSTGTAYCTLCALRSLSCRNGFRSYGPLVEGGCYPPAPGDRARCCRERGVGCQVVGQACDAVVGNAVLPDSSIGCAPGMRCAATTVDRASGVLPGTCARAGPAGRWCNNWTCMTDGRDGVCSLQVGGASTPQQRIPATCAAWAERSDGGDKPDCEFECNGGCVFPRENRPVSTGRVRYCSLCVLKKVSCGSSFSVRWWVDAGGPVFSDSSEGCPPDSVC